MTAGRIFTKIYIAKKGIKYSSSKIKAERYWARIDSSYSSTQPSLCETWFNWREFMGIKSLQIVCKYTYYLSSTFVDIYKCLLFLVMKALNTFILKFPRLTHVWLATVSDMLNISNETSLYASSQQFLHFKRAAVQYCSIALSFLWHPVISVQQQTFDN